MVPQPPTAPVWTPKFAEETKAFLESPAGQALLLKLAYSRPQYSTFSSSEKRLIESGAQEGYEQALIELQKSKVIPFTN